MTDKEPPAISVCTLFEKDYHYGLGALVNSLYAHGYSGVVWAGYRGPLPPWAAKAEKKEKWTQLEVTHGLSVNFVRLNTDTHFGKYKPAWMMSVFSDLDTQCDALYYFDPDIIIGQTWDFFAEWALNGIAICQDVYFCMPQDHPIRKMWERFAHEHGLKITNKLNCYFNSGFIGVKREYIKSLEIWKELLRLAAENDSWTGRSKIDDKFIHKDQDEFNIMAMVTEYPLSTVGPQGMGFVPGKFIMAHAASKPKPWAKNMITNTLFGSPLKTADKEYFKYVQFPIRLYSKQQFFLRTADLNIASVMSRILSRR